MFKRQTEGSVVCPYCGKLVGVNDKECWNCGKRNPGMWGFAPLLRRFGYNLEFVSIVTWVCTGLFIATLLYDPHGIRPGGLSLIQPSSVSLFTFGASGSFPVFEAGRWWTLLSAGWLHGGVLHILFNMLWVRQLAPATAELFGTSRTVIIYTVSSVAGFLLSSITGLITGAQLTIGASAAIFGLLGALVVYGRRGGSSRISGQAMTYAVILFVFGFIFPGIDNAAHLGGFLGGFAIAWILNPLQRERMEHFIAAIVCLALTALSILVSFFQTPVFY
ncbi:MAG: rhomboid family intramembrane serine protease [Acidobacteria bacterium]|nr:rhomboid family intramembrane serine protease [Acidobacteriota bacterium]